MEYVMQVVNGFLFGIGFIIASFVMNYLFHLKVL